MSKHIHPARLAAILALAVATILGTGLIGTAVAQQSQSQDQQPTAQAPDQQQPSQQTPDQQTPDRRRAPDPSQQTPPDAAQDQPQAGQTFSGTIMKQGDKYVLQEESSGTTYDVDHQAEVKKFEGKKVRIHGTLDPDRKMIHIQ
jgi:cytoskeletal protein RodZ